MRRSIESSRKDRDAPGSGRPGKRTAEEDPSCPGCGSRKEVASKGFCSECEKGFSPPDPVFFDTMVVLSAISTILALLVLEGGRPGFGGPELIRTVPNARVLSILAMVPVLVTVAMRWRHLFSITVLRSLTRTLLPIMLFFPMVVLLGNGSTILGIVLFVIWTTSVAALAVFARKEVLSVGPPRLASSFVGVLLFELGLAVSLGSISLPKGPWIIEGPPMVLFGMILYLVPTYLSVRDSDLVSIEGGPVSMWVMGSVLSFSMLWTSEVATDDLTLIRIAIANSVLLLCASLVSLAARRGVDRIMERTEDEIGRRMESGWSLFEEGRPYYALQQLDRALRLNPVDGFGRSRDMDNPIFKMEGSSHTATYTFSPTPNEVALNEKGVTLSMQGRYADALRCFQEATRRQPEFLQPHWNLSTLHMTMPGKGAEGSRSVDYIVAARSLYMRKWLKRGIRRDQGDWMLRCMGLYKRTLDGRAKVLSSVAGRSDVWDYFRITGGS